MVSGIKSRCADQTKLEIIHEYIGERGTDRVTWIVIWLIVIACLVEFVSIPSHRIGSQLTPTG